MLQSLTNESVMQARFNVVAWFLILIMEL
jgi:hypothetical protein